MRIPRLLLLITFLVSCGSKTSKDTISGKPPGEELGEGNPTKLDDTPAPMQAERVLRFTPSGEPWKLNPIRWANARGKSKGIASFKNIERSSSDTTEHTISYLVHYSDACGPKKEQQEEVQFYLDTMEGTTVKETRKWEFGKTLSLVRSHETTYTLRVEVLNDANCAAHHIELGLY